MILMASLATLQQLIRHRPTSLLAKEELARATNVVGARFPFHLGVICRASTTGPSLIYLSLSRCGVRWLQNKKQKKKKEKKKKRRGRRKAPPVLTEFLLGTRLIFFPLVFSLTIFSGAFSAGAISFQSGAFFLLFFFFFPLFFSLSVFKPPRTFLPLHICAYLATCMSQLILPHLFPSFQQAKVRV